MPIGSDDIVLKAKLKRFTNRAGKTCNFLEDLLEVNLDENLDLFIRN